MDFSPTGEGVDIYVYSGVADPDLNPDSSDPYVFGPPGSRSGPISQRYGSCYYTTGTLYMKTSLLGSVPDPLYF